MTAGLDSLARAGYPKLAAAIQEMIMTSSGVIPEHRTAVFCDARDSATGRTCDLEPGHDGPHETFISLTWLRDDDEPPA